MRASVEDRRGDAREMTYKKRKSSRRRRRQRRGTGMGLVTVAVLAICFVLLYNSKQMKKEIRTYEATVSQLEDQIEAQKEQNTLLTQQEEYINSDEYYKELAREKLGLAHPDDIIFQKSE